MSIFSSKGKKKQHNPVGRCFSCNQPIHFNDQYCAVCGAINDKWKEPSQIQCGNCHAFLKSEDRYCRLCGTKIGNGAYEPYQDIIEIIYGPMPEVRIHICKKCGHYWKTCLMIDNEKFCPKCGGSAPQTNYTPIVDSEEDNGTPSDKYRLITSDNNIIKLNPPIVTIGRSPENDIHIEEQTVSRKHAHLTYHNDNWYLTDDGSNNGTSLNKTVIIPGKEYLLHPGDKITIESEQFLFQF